MSTLWFCNMFKNVDARIVLQLKPQDHITYALLQLYWFPIQYQIQYRLYLVMHLAKLGSLPNLNS